MNLQSTIEEKIDWQKMLIQLNDSICTDKNHPDYHYCHHIQNEIINWIKIIPIAENKYFSEVHSLVYLVYYNAVCELRSSSSSLIFRSLEGLTLMFDPVRYTNALFI